MDSAAVSIFNQLLGQYNGSIVSIQAGSIEIAKELFNAIALVSVAVLGINRLLVKDVDMVGSNMELIRLLIYLNVLYLFISQYDQFLPYIINSFRSAGIYMGSKASGYVLTTNPGDIINIAVSIASKILNVAKNQTSLVNFGMSLIAVIAAGVVLYCFGTIAIELVLIEIGSRIILAAGIFLLAFAGSSWTREYAEHYVHAFFHIGVKMLFIYVLVGIGAGLTQNWSKVLDNVPIGQIMEYYIAVIMASFVYYKICQKVPDQAVVYFTGRLSMNFETASTIHSAITKTREGIVGTIKNVKAAGAGLEGISAGIQGMSKAVSTARKVGEASLAGQGKKVNLESVGIEAIKTLGAAAKVEWDKEVDETRGGKLAKNILATIPKPKRVSKKVPVEDTVDYTI